MNEQTDRIDKFITYFKDEFELIESIGEGWKYKVHKKALYCSMIDAISGVVFPSKRNRARFIELILIFGEWKYAEYISVPHIARLLALNPSPEYSKLRKYIFTEYEKWRSGKLVPLTNDVDSKKVYSLWPKGKDHLEPIAGVKLDSLKHVQLLYSYRNSLVHEFLPLGSDMEMPEDSDPYYLSIMSRIRDSNEFYWNLIYPTPFFHSLCENIFKNVETYFKENKIDPLEIIKSGRYWLKGLNNK